MSAGFPEDKPPNHNTTCHVCRSIIVDFEVIRLLYFIPLGQCYNGGERGEETRKSDFRIVQIQYILVYWHRRVANHGESHTSHNVVFHSPSGIMRNEECDPFPSYQHSSTANDKSTLPVFNKISVQELPFYSANIIYGLHFIANSMYIGHRTRSASRNIGQSHQYDSCLSD